MKVRPDPVEGWLAALERRHLSQLTFAEVRHALQALSSLYVERRGRLGSRPPFAARGKRAAYALYYGPVHFLLVRETLRALGAEQLSPGRILDLGCGTGAAGAAWALACAGECSPELSGVDRSPWAAEEARWTWRALGLKGHAGTGRIEETSLDADSIVAAFTVNELEEIVRGRLLTRMLEAARRGATVLVVEPIARRPIPWWGSWAREFEAVGGRADEWRFSVALPELVRSLGQAAGLDPRELAGRTLWSRSGEPVP